MKRLQFNISDMDFEWMDKVLCSGNTKISVLRDALSDYNISHNLNAKGDPNFIGFEPLSDQEEDLYKRVSNLGRKAVVYDGLVNECRELAKLRKISYTTDEDLVNQVRKFLGGEE